MMFWFLLCFFLVCGIWRVAFLSELCFVIKIFSTRCRFYSSPIKLRVAFIRRSFLRTQTPKHIRSSDQWKLDFHIPLRLCITSHFFVFVDNASLPCNLRSNDIQPKNEVAQDIQRCKIPTWSENENQQGTTTMFDTIIIMDDQTTVGFTLFFVSPSSLQIGHSCELLTTKTNEQLLDWQPLEKSGFLG